jgi:hypothetical protein
MGIDVLSEEEIDAIAGGAEPTESQMRRIYGLEHEVVHPYQNTSEECKSNQKWNPSCFGGLGWKMKKVAAKSGKEQEFRPTATRSDLVPYGGLKNLGATCYMNSMLQCLFSNTVFRRRILELDHTLISQASANNALPLEELRRLFANLRFSKAKHYDPTPFVSSLQLSTTVRPAPRRPPTPFAPPPPP